MIRSRNIHLPTLLIGCLTTGLLAYQAASPQKVSAQTRMNGPQSNANNRTPTFGIGTRFTQSGAAWNQYSRNQQYNYSYNGSPYPSCIYPGLPAGSVTYVQPDGYGGYAIGAYGCPPSIDTTLPSVYGLYGGVSGYVDVNEGSVQDILPVTTPVYALADQPSQTPQYQVNDYSYTINNYYSGTTDKQPASLDSEQVSEGSYNTALGDLQQAWSTGDFSLLKKHLPGLDDSVKVSVGGQSSYAIASGKFADITQQTFAKLTTYSFVVTDVEKHADGSVTGYVTHTYAPAGESDGKRQTMYLSFTLARVSGEWLLTEMDSSKSPILSSNGLPTKSPDQDITPTSVTTYTNH